MMSCKGKDDFDVIVTIQAYNLYLMKPPAKDKTLTWSFKEQKNIESI